VHVELLLELFVGIVDAKLLKTAEMTGLSALNVTDLLISKVSKP
jgi:hypothetical protein